MIYKSTGKLLKLLRVHTDMKQKELASKLKLSQAEVSDWEREKKVIPMKHFVKFPKIFGVDVILTPKGFIFKERRCNVSASNL